MLNINFNSIKKTNPSLYQKIGLCHDDAGKILTSLRGAEFNMAMAGWAKKADGADEKLLTEKIYRLAEKIKAVSDTVVIVGIGGSYMGIMAGLEFIKNNAKGSEPEILFAGFNLSSNYHKKLFENLKSKNFSLIMISKSGETIEPFFVFEKLKEILRGSPQDNSQGDKKNQPWQNRIVTITDEKNGALRQETEREGYENLIIPSDTGGRFSALTPVALLPFAIMGIDINEILAGSNIVKDGEYDDAIIKFAKIKTALAKEKFPVEILGAFDLSLDPFMDFLVQLLGESLGKDGLGMFPVKSIFTRDLHSIGQFLQEGSPYFFENVFSIKPSADDEIRLEKKSSFVKKYGDLPMHAINDAAKNGMVRAHEEIKTPIVEIEFSDNSAKTFGEAVTFFEFMTAVTGFLMEVNPFNQPGVEAYKTEMRKIIKTIA